MVEYLLFQLYSPLASWGDVAVGEARVSANHPGRSMLVGLLGAALGVRRDDEAKQATLANAYRFAVRVSRRGLFMRDYHTTQVAGRVALKGRPHVTRRDELSIPKGDLHTILSGREYRCDAYCQIAVEHVDGGWSLADLESALRTPALPLYLGRKSCPPALPLEPCRVQATDVAAAFMAAAFHGPGTLCREGYWDRAVPTDDPGGLYWDDGMQAGLAATETFTRRDQPRNRRRWQFDERLERHAPWPQEAVPCT